MDDDQELAEVPAQPAPAGGEPNTTATSPELAPPDPPVGFDSASVALSPVAESAGYIDRVGESQDREPIGNSPIDGPHLAATASLSPIPEFSVPIADVGLVSGDSPAAAIADRGAQIDLGDANSVDNALPESKFQGGEDASVSVDANLVGSAPSPAASEGIADANPSGPEYEEAPIAEDQLVNDVSFPSPPKGKDQVAEENEDQAVGNSSPLHGHECEDEGPREKGNLAHVIGDQEERLLSEDNIGIAEEEMQTEMETDAGDMETETEAADMETEVADMEEAETELAEAVGEVAETGRADGGKRKRGGRNSKTPVKATLRKKSEEDVCFICFDGGELVLCDRRGCPKAYHPSCVNRDEAFFRAKGKWNCGWHLCSICEKNAYYMCYTCTFSLCKGCIKDAVIYCVRGNKGLCEACMRTVMLIEKNEQVQVQVDFNDRSSWEYLFKDYWTDLKENLCLTVDEFARARNPWKGSDVAAGRQDSPHELYDANNDVGSDPDNSIENQEIKPRKRKGKKLSKSLRKVRASPNVTPTEVSAAPSNTEWASKELLALVMHMKNGDGSALSQFDVQALLLEYIKRNKLRDPRRKSQIICDSRLENLFGKARVGHFEMLKLLESHFVAKEDSQADDLQGSVVDTEASQLEVDGNDDVLTKSSKDKKRKMRKKGYNKGRQSNIDDYAAIDIHNITLIYLRRNLIEELLGDAENLHDKVVGSFVRIRISGSVQKQDIYRLVQVVGTSKAAEPYKVGKKATDVVLEILNLNKTEVISIDIVSNQDFTEDECKRLRQSIKCGLINRLTVGDVLEKAMSLHAVRVNDWLEAEIVRLNHLRDRASEKGRKKELRECVEKLQLLKTAEERQRRLEEVPEVHADPNMDPSHESEEDEEEEDKRDIYTRPRGSSLGRRGREPVSLGTGVSASNDSWSVSRKASSNWEQSRNLYDKGFLNRGDDTAAPESMNETSSTQGRDRDTHQSNSGEKLKISTNVETGSLNGFPSPVVPRSAGIVQSATRISETEKIWHYQDPSGKIQGPFSMVQLRKWSGYFPANLRIWKNTEKQEDSILFSDALAECFPKDQSAVHGGFQKSQQTHNPQMSSTLSVKPYGTPLPQGREVQGGGNVLFSQNPEAGKLHVGVGSSFGQSAGDKWRPQPEVSSSKAWVAPSSIETPKFSRDRWDSDHGGTKDSFNPPSPTPTQSTVSWTGGHDSERKQVPTSFPVQPAGSVLDGNGVPSSSAPLITESGHFSESPNPASSSINIAGFVGGSSVSQSAVNDFSSVSGSSPRPMVGKGINESGGASVLGGASSNSGGDPRTVGTILSNLAQSIETRGWGPGSVSNQGQIASQPLSGEVQSWGSAPTQKLESNSTIPIPVQQPAYGHWGGPSPFIAGIPAGGNPVGSFTPNLSSLPPSDQWRPQVSGNPLESGSNVHPSAPQNMPWSVGVAENPSVPPYLRPENLNTVMTWGPVPGNPNMGWGGPAPTNTNINQGTGKQGPPAPGNANPGPGPGSTNMNWGPAPQGMSQGPTPGNPNFNWGAVGQGQQTGNPNLGHTNMNWGSSGQGPVPGNGNPGWVAPTGNPGTWVNDQNHNGDRFSGQRDRGYQGGNSASGYGAGRSRNRQSLGGQGGSNNRYASRGDPRVCKYYESGNCRRGSNCDYLHP